MQITNEKAQIIAEAVINNLTVQGKFGANEFTVQDLFNQNTVKLDTINNLYGSITSQLDAIPKKSLFDRTTESATTKKLKAQQLLLETVFEIRSDIEKEAKTLKAKQLEAARKLAVLRNIKDEKVLNDLKALSQEELDKQIAEAEQLVEA